MRWVQTRMAENSVHSRTLDLDGVPVFYREAGPTDAPVLLLPHGYPCSSYEFRNLMPRLADRWRTIAPDFPGCGYSGTPDGFAYDFDGYAAFLGHLAERLGVERYVLYLHDFGTWIGLRLAMAQPERLAALVVQNGDIYEDVMGPKYQGLKDYWADPSPERLETIRAAVSEEGYREEFLNGSEQIADRVPPDLWTLHWALTTPRRQGIHVEVIRRLNENLAWFPRYQAFLRERRPPTLIVWGPNDGYMPEPAARAWLRDLPQADLHLLPDAGHWLLETHLDKATDLIRGFLDRTFP